MKLKDIDPAFDAMKEFSKATGSVTKHISEMRNEAIFKDGVVDSKTKAMTAAIWSIAMRCEPCFKFYILKAKELGATKEEVGEFMAVAATMGGCVGEMWALKAFQEYLGDENPGSACC